MKNLVALLCMISALVGSVSCIRCYSCESRTSTKCNVSETECFGNRCMTACQYFKVGEKEFTSIYRGCANDTLCGTKGSGIVENMMFRFHLTCCTGELCNTAQYELLEEDPTPNGVICPFACCNNTLEECKSDKMINCTGSMNKCLEYRAKVRIPDGTVKKLSMKGCVNSDCCRYNFDSYIAIEEQQRVLLNC
ncbi:phospholipase A2 inhibitor gamma subunit B-like [Anomaloglossus baeobatrachus]|uniref:phospholipase A2 inhibitor gamma subunit B-like n=1 Tax=Anomaloglossus baeobatrachus TaxID=238106 RepID=UPI003F4FD7E3